ncbi:calcium-binding protein [Methylobacterium terricola]|uniref:Calcium-binding protein n=1 Tax=Methylobacterium terricola TaxID=2583531 RepID=A0A5C4LGN5_9HYPH|nr:calcium-binding protein [Methylobacterium terricola]TNC13286.1 calcium-binding protein [Methylobacterium terricola]
MRLASFGQLERIYGIQVASLANAFGSAMPPGATANRTNVALPAGWSAVGPSSLGLGPDAVDHDGYYIIESPLTGRTYSGPQAQIYEERDARGRVSRLSVTFVGTNSPVDLADYTQLNSGEIAPNMNPLLTAVRDYAIGKGLGADDVIVTGYSLGAAYTNVMAKYADTLAGGFFADSNYIAHAVPYTYEGHDRVLNIGYENDVVHRAAGDFDSLGEAIQAAPGLMGQDYALGSSTDNLILFGDDYADPAWPYGPFALYNIPGGWAAHVAGLTSDAVARITQSAFYDETARDSLVIVSNLSGATRGVTWVEDLHRPSDRHDHVGDSAFLIGSQYDDRLRGNVGNDYIDAMAGDDTIRPGDGQNRVEGGSGTDTLELSGTMRDWSVSRLMDGTTAFFSKSHGLDIVSGVERVTFLDAGIPGRGRSYALESDRLEDLTWSGAFERFDQDVAYTAARQGTAGNDTLTGSRVFGLAGNDTITGTSASDLLYGGAGDDRLDGRGGNDAIYGGEGNDWLTGGGGNDLLNGGLGDDLFVVDARLSGRVTIEDFRLSDVEQDRIRIIGSPFRSTAELRNHGEQTADGLLLHLGAGDLMIEHATWSSLTPGTVSFG